LIRDLTQIETEAGDTVKEEIQPEVNPTEQRIVESYKAKSDKCNACIEYCEENGLQLHGPLSFFNIGEKFDHDRYRVVFVGKNSWYDKSNVESLPSLASTKLKDCRLDGSEWFTTRLSRYWGCIQDIAKQLYPEKRSDEDMIDLLDNISITNLTKCNTSTDYRDTTPFRLTENCIEIFEEEMKALRPRHIVFFTGTGYDSHIGKLNFGYVISPKEITNRTYKKEIKNRPVWWWHREFYESDEVWMHFLRTRHPQGAPRELVDEIAKWIRKEKV
jgi:hypothetical protein